MGCDIHPIVQRRVGDTWERVPLPCEDMWQYPLGERNYCLFAALAGVRNSYGFVPIAERRGLPDGFEEWAETGLIEHTLDECDYPEAYRDECDHRFDMGDHSYSWLTLAELDAYNWDQPGMECGVIRQAVYEEWRRLGFVGPPATWSGFVFGGGTWTVDRECYDAMPVKPKDDGRLYIRAEWPIVLSECTEFSAVVLPWLRTLGAPDDVRIVFGFDS